MRFSLLALVVLASCSDEPDEKPFATRYCEAWADCLSGNAADVAACAATTEGEAEYARILGCGDKVKAHETCVLWLMTCVSKGSFTIARCDADRRALNECVRAADAKTECGVVTAVASGDPIERLCRNHNACRCGSETAVQGCIASVRGEQGYADAYGCGALFRDVVECRVASLQCRDNVAQYPATCEPAVAVYNDCVRAASAVR